MPNLTGIEWTATVLPDGTTRSGFTSNPIKYRDRATGRDVWACVKHSPGCAHCYAEATALRYGRGGPFTKAEMAKVEPYLCEKELDRLVRMKALAGSRVFLGDMTDLFGPWVPDHLLDRLFAALALRRDVTFQILTKRADRLNAYFAGRTLNDVLVGVLQEFDAGAYRDAPPKWLNLFQCVYRVTEAESARGTEWKGRLPAAWPLPNVWLGVSVEDQTRADDRVPHLLATPAAVRFLSCEPLLGPVSLAEWFGLPLGGNWGNSLIGDPSRFWVIVGGESGGGARRLDLAWVRSLRDQCRGSGVAFFCKQLGARPHELGCQQPNCPDDACRIRLELRDRKGGDMAEWPEDLRVREFPKPGGA